MRTGLFLAAVIFIFWGCIQNHNREKQSESTAEAFLGPDTLCMKKKELVETILNYPDFIRYSRLRNVRKAFDTIYIIFDRDDLNCILPPYVQQGDTLKVIYKSDSVDTIKEPIYEIKKNDIVSDTTAYIHIEFDVSGAIAYGNLKQIDGQWIPDSDFVIGVR